jgi:bifunctional UDP-N-acetylglucosamine pyrophosphorylase/glucosamine-1-phosphate N-acetyltransferase
MEMGYHMDKIALILAAGKSVRMNSNTPKVLHDVCGVPIFEHVTRAIDPVCDEKYAVISINDQERMSERYGGSIGLVIQDANGYGTGYAVMCAADHLKGKRGTVLVTAGDMPLILPESYVKLFAEMEAGNSAAMLTEVVDDPSGYGRVIRGADNAVEEIVEHKDLKPDQIRINEINSAVYCFDIESLLWALPRIKYNKNSNELYLTDVIGILIEAGKSVAGVNVTEKGECMGINDRVQLASAERAMRKRINEKHMRAGVTILNPECTYIHPDAIVGRDTIIYPGCELGAGCVVGSNCVIRQGCVVSGSRIADSTLIPAYSIISGA